jgi:hypothetical protein
MEWDPRTCEVFLRGWGNRVVTQEGMKELFEYIKKRYKGRAGVMLDTTHAGTQIEVNAVVMKESGWELKSKHRNHNTGRTIAHYRRWLQIAEE